VEEALRAIGQTMASMGAGDKRLDGPKKVEYRLSQLLSGWKKADPAPSRVKPVPLSLLNHMYESAVGLDDTFSLAVADISYIGFFYICRPGETTEPSAADSRSSAFRLCDTEFTHGQRLLRTLRDALDVLALASAGALIFTDQKNAVRGEKHILGRSGHPFACPVLALLRRVKHLRAHNAPPETPLYTVYTSSRVRHVRPADITASLRASAVALFDVLGIEPGDISASSLRAGGAMALFSAGIATDTLRMVARWNSDAMFRYLHVQCFPLMEHLSRTMVAHGSFSLLPGQHISTAAARFLNNPSQASQRQL
jgi:hypothetical protein